MMTDNLLPCPFCGGADLEVVIIDCRDREGLPATWACAGCGARGPWDYIPDEKCTAKIDGLWNKRVWKDIISMGKNKGGTMAAVSVWLDDIPSSLDPIEVWSQQDVSDDKKPMGSTDLEASVETYQWSGREYISNGSHSALASRSEQLARSLYLMDAGLWIITDCLFLGLVGQTYPSQDEMDDAIREQYLTYIERQNLTRDRKHGLDDDDAGGRG